MLNSLQHINQMHQKKSSDFTFARCLNVVFSFTQLNYLFSYFHLQIYECVSRYLKDKIEYNRKSLIQFDSITALMNVSKCVCLCVSIKYKYNYQIQLHVFHVQLKRLNTCKPLDFIVI